MPRTIRVVVYSDLDRGAGSIWATRIPSAMSTQTRQPERRLVVGLVRQQQVVANGRREQEQQAAPGRGSRPGSRGSGRSAA